MRHIKFSIAIFMLFSSAMMVSALPINMKNCGEVCADIAATRTTIQSSKIQMQSASGTGDSQTITKRRAHDEPDEDEPDEDEPDEDEPDEDEPDEDEPDEDETDENEEEEDEEEGDEVDDEEDENEKDEKDEKH